MMQYKWNGNDGSYTDPANWTPQDVPLYGSGTSAVIQSGTVTLSDAAPNGIFITWRERAKTPSRTSCWTTRRSGRACPSA